jgi:hypothetical protein
MVWVEYAGYITDKEILTVAEEPAEESADDQ